MSNLLITTIGKENHLDVWTAGEANFSVATLDYIETPSFKYPGIFNMLDVLPQYDYYFMPDEDIYITTEDINRLFALMAEHELELAQPSIEKSETSFPSWETFIHRDGPDIIPTHFVEVMCPCFSRWALYRCLSIFPTSKSGWGLDIVWSTLMQGRKMAIINSIVARHTRPIGSGNLYKALQTTGERPSTERKRLMKQHGITRLPNDIG